MTLRTRLSAFCLDCATPLPEPCTRCRRCQSLQARRVLRTAAGARRQADGPLLQSPDTRTERALAATGRDAYVDLADGRPDASGRRSCLPTEPGDERSVRDSITA